MGMNPVRGDDADELSEEYEELNEELKPAAYLKIEQEAREFGDCYEVRLNTGGPTLLAQTMGTLAEHDLSVEELEPGKWQLWQEDDE